MISEIKPQTKISLALATSVVLACLVGSWRVWLMADEFKASVRAVAERLETKPSKEDVDRQVDARIAIALQSLRIPEQIAEMRTMLGVVREDLKEIRNGK